MEFGDPEVAGGRIYADADDPDERTFDGGGALEPAVGGGSGVAPTFDQLAGGAQLLDETGGVETVVGEVDVALGGAGGVVNGNQFGFFEGGVLAEALALLADVGGMAWGGTNVLFGDGTGFFDRGFVDFQPEHEQEMTGRVELLSRWVLVSA